MWSFRKNLESVPTSLVHHLEDLHDEVIGHLLVKEVAHGIHKDHTRLTPRHRYEQRPRVDCDLEAVPVLRLAHGLEPSGHSFSVAVLAANAELRAAGYRVPRSFRPFNARSRQL